MRILLVGAVPGRRHVGPVLWAGDTYEITAHRFSSFADFRTPARDTLAVDRQALAAFVDATRGFDVVVCESPEALVLGREWARRGEVPCGVVAFDVHQLHRVHAMRAWYRTEEGDDPWPEVRDAPWLAWSVNSAHQVAPLVAAGVPESRIHRIQGCSGSFHMLLPNLDALLGGGPEADGEEFAGLPAGGVAMPGTGRRDHVTGLRAAVALPALPFVAVAEHAERRRPGLAAEGLAELANVRWLAPLSLEGFIALLRRARMVVVPLEPGTGDGGHLTVGLAHRLGVPVVASDVPGIVDYVPDDAAALVPAGDAAALARTIRALWDDPAAGARLVEAGRRAEDARCEAFWRGMHAAIAEAGTGTGDRRTLVGRG